MSRSVLYDPRAVVPLAAATALSLMLVGGCGGSRVAHDRVVQVGNGYGPAAAAAAAAAAPASGTTTADAAPAARAPVTTGSAPTGTGPTSPNGQPAAAAAQAPVAGGAAGQPVVTGQGVVGGRADAARNPVAAAAAPAACAANLAPIAIGETLAASGLVGAAIAGLRTGLAVWARAVNARGGVECHPVQLTQLDDASDPAKVSANWNTMVHDKGAIAILAVGVPIAIAALRSAAERDQIPVVGGDITAEDWVNSPFLFPTGGAPLTSYDGGVIEAAATVRDNPKAGLFYCVEASICTGLKNNFPHSVARAKAASGPLLAVSLTQPDYTSECQQMKSAGVNIIFFGLDGSASIRAARSCASLNYHPTIATGAIAVSAAAAQDQGLRRDNTYLGSGVVPYTTTDTAGIKAFHAAMARYAPSNPEDQQTLLGWASGKLFEAALAKVAAKARAGSVTTSMVLEGLWQLKDEKLGGLSPGATFAKGQHAKLVDCYYPLKLDPKGFSAPKGSTPVCYGSGNTAVGAAAPPAAFAPDLVATEPSLERARR